MDRSRAEKIWAPRTIAVSLALLLQICIFLMLAPEPRTVGPAINQAREVEIQIWRRAPTAPRTKTSEKERRPAQARARPAPFVPTPLASGPKIDIDRHQPDWRGVAGALFGCELGQAPLFRTKQRPCLGLQPHAQAAPQRLLMTPPRAKHAMRWARALAHERSPLLLPGALLAPLFYLKAVLSGSIRNRHSIARDPARWPTYVEPGRFLSGYQRDPAHLSSTPSPPGHR